MRMKTLHRAHRALEKGGRRPSQVLSTHLTDDGRQLVVLSRATVVDSGGDFF